LGEPGSFNPRGSCVNPDSPTDTIGCGVGVAIRGGARDIWIDHNDFDHCGAKCLDVWTVDNAGGRGRAEGGDLITISNNVFRNSYYAILTGAAANLTRERIPEEMRVTLYGNLFYNVFRRSPRAAVFSKVHMFNNVVKYWGRTGVACVGRESGFGASSMGEAQLLVENNVFIARPGTRECKTAIDISDQRPQGGVARGIGLVRARGNEARNGAMLSESQAGRVFDPRDQSHPAYYYPYTLRPTQGLVEAVEADAGVQGFPKPAYR
jgi:pectate lyase